MFTTDHATIVADVKPGDAKKAAKLNTRGVRYVECGHFGKAIRSFEAAIAADSDFGPAHNNLGLVYYESGDLYLAATEFETAARMMPDRADPYGNLGLALESGGKVEEAIAMFETAHDIEPMNPVYLGNLIRARMRRGDADDTIRMQLKQLLFIDTRPEWIEWTQDQLAFFMNPRIQAQSVSPEFNPSLTPDDRTEYQGGPELTLPGNPDVISSPYPTDGPAAPPNAGFGYRPGDDSSRNSGRFNDYSPGFESGTAAPDVDQGQWRRAR
jgi:Tfp pilus assembly protein PilF